MKAQIRRILDMVAADRLSPEDAGALLAALSPKLHLSSQHWPHVFGLLGEGGFSPEEVAVLLEVRTGLRRSQPGGDFEAVIEDVPRLVRDAMNGAFGRSRGMGRGSAWDGDGRRAGRPGSVLRVQVEEADGSEMRANLPLSLAEHTAKILPPRVIAALERGGISPDALTAMLSANPGVGELLSLEGADGSEISLRVE